MLIFRVVDQWLRPMGRVRARMRLGRGVIDDTVPWVFIHGGTPALMVSCGNDNTLVLAVTGLVWNCGKGEHGRLGHRDETNKMILTFIETGDRKGVDITLSCRWWSAQYGIGGNGSRVDMGIRRKRTTGPQHLRKQVCADNHGTRGVQYAQSSIIDRGSCSLCGSDDGRGVVGMGIWVFQIIRTG
mmetsp:Transcript_40896/g.60169  ORF Transcript_40896/g.60169 Transcript_40896/m.60169 type:complete len:185 (+) Transcript_40896:115-669(+)